MDVEPEEFNVMTVEEELMSEFGQAPDGLYASDLEPLRNELGAEVVDGWIGEAKRRGLIAEIGSAEEARLLITTAGQQLFDQLFPRVIGVGLPVLPRQRRSVAQRFRRKRA